MVNRRMRTATANAASGIDEALPLRIETLGTVERVQFGAAGFRTFLGIADQWGFSIAERRILLGDVAESTYHNWKNGRFGEPTRDVLERLSLVLGIYKALRLIFTDESTALRWLRGENAEPVFAGRAPLARMLDGSIDDLYAVRRYLDAWRGGWP